MGNGVNGQVLRALTGYGPRALKFTKFANPQLALDLIAKYVRRELHNTQKVMAGPVNPHLLTVLQCGFIRADGSEGQQGETPGERDVVYTMSEL